MEGTEVSSFCWLSSECGHVFNLPFVDRNRVEWEHEMVPFPHHWKAFSQERELRLRV